MNSIRILFYMAAILCLTYGQMSAAGTPAVKLLGEFETKANSATNRSSESLILPHVEIPIEMVSLDFAKRLDPRIATALVFEKDGKKYVRWILNPEDRKWGRKLIAYFEAKGVSLEINYYFKAHRTASRSYLAEDPITGIEFSVKSSTDVAGGAWKDKKQTVGDAIDGRLTSDFLVDQNNKNPFENFAIMDEPAILKIEGLDQAVVIRDLGVIKNPNNKKIYVPGFAVLHDRLGYEIALKNGSSDPESFWTEHYIKAVGRALGELAARTGLQYDSPHSQNFLVELDEHYRPTGKIIFRDMADLTLDVNFLNALLGANNNYVTRFNQASNKHGSIEVGFGPLHGNVAPQWLSPAKYAEWKNVFFDQFEKSFQKISGYDIEHLKAERIESRAYFNASYNLSDKQEFKPLFNQMMQKGVVGQIEKSCRQLFSSK